MFVGHDHEVLVSCGWLKQDAVEPVAANNGWLQAVDSELMFSSTCELRFASATEWKASVRLHKDRLRGGLSCVCSAVCCWN